MNRIIVNNFGGYSTERRQCVRAVSEQISERRFEVRRKGVTPYGC